MTLVAVDEHHARLRGTLLVFLQSGGMVHKEA
jgi:hypothetical protein